MVYHTDDMLPLPDKCGAFISVAMDMQGTIHLYESAVAFPEVATFNHNGTVTVHNKANMFPSIVKRSWVVHLPEYAGWGKASTSF